MGALSGAEGGTTGVGVAGMASIEAMRNNPQIQMLRQLVAQNPQMIQPILQQLGASNPQFASWIRAHPNEFIALLNPDGEDDAYMPPDMSEEDEEAIQRVGSSRCLSVRSELTRVLAVPPRVRAESCHGGISCVR